ncbi:MAG TPA: DUF1206 domain-containing protein, partial [Vicinamibacteria bacterium]|nr:DUF1206 domain-containing protein [Vicinamibacteria bacterium]
GVAHMALAVTAFGVAAGIRGHRAGAVSSWAARAMEAPVGGFLVGAAGVIVMVVGAFQFKKAFRRDFLAKEHIDGAGMGPGMRDWVERLGRMGHAARGITFEIVGFFLLRAALHRDPGEARGVDGAFRFLRTLEHGNVALALVAAGVVAYGAYTLLLARYRHVGG